MKQNQNVGLYETLLNCKTINELTGSLRTYMRNAHTSTQENWSAIQDCLETYLQSIYKKSTRPAAPEATYAAQLRESNEFKVISRFLQEEVKPRVEADSSQPGVRLSC